MKDFEDTRRLDDAALNDLLAQGDPRDRVLAIWALALRSAAAATTMAHQLHGEPDPGVRRALAVVLAGSGELDLLVAISRHDPSVHVRASAMQMVVRFAAAGRAPWSVVLAGFADVAEVRASIAGQLDATSPPELRAAVVACLRDEDETVRREAFETCVKLVKAGAAQGEILRDALDDATAGECTNALSLWFAAERPEVIAAALAGARREVRACALRMHPELILTRLAPLLGEDAELYEQLRFTHGLRHQDASLALLLAIALRAPRWLGVLEEVVARIRVLERLPVELVPRLRDLAVTVTAVGAEDAGKDAGELTVYDDDEDDPEDLLRDQLERVRLRETLDLHVARLTTVEPG